MKAKMKWEWEFKEKIKKIDLARIADEAPKDAICVVVTWPRLDNDRNTGAVLLTGAGNIRARAAGVLSGWSHWARILPGGRVECFSSPGAPDKAVMALPAGGSVDELHHAARDFADRVRKIERSTVTIEVTAYPGGVKNES